MKKVFIITGDYSGDIHASYVVKILKQQSTDIEIEGIGGENLRNTGIKLFSDQSKMGAVGLNFKIVFDHFLLGKKLVNYLKNEYKPDLVLLIDYGVFNLSISKFLKRARIKTYYYIPPQVWASRKWRLNTIKKNIDKVLCIFPFEVNMYKSYGIDTHYCGHPLVKQILPKADKNEFFEKYGFDKNKKLVSIFPGSRIFELNQLMKLFLKSAEELQQKHTDIQVCISQASNLSDKIYNKYLNNSKIKVIKGDNQALLSVSDSLILASGTVALEATLYKTPMLIAYKGPWFFYLVYLLVRCIKMVSLPNIILNKITVPELIQTKCTVKNIVQETENNLYNETIKNERINDLEQVNHLLSDKYSAEEVAKEIIENI